jgi:ATP-dependent 26S proteasome regulatory subunit
MFFIHKTPQTKVTMEWLSDLLRMKIVNSVNNNSRVRGGLPWRKIGMYILISKYPVLYDYISKKTNETIIPYITKKLIGEYNKNDDITIDNAKSVIKMSLKNNDEDVLFKNILSTHKYEFDQLTIKKQSVYASKSKTIELQEDIHLQLSFDSIIIETDKDGNKTESSKKDLDFNDSIGYVYSNVLSIKELSEFLETTYNTIEKPKKAQILNKINEKKLYSMNVLSSTGFDYKSKMMEVEHQKVNISKSMENLFLDPKLYHLLITQITRFKDVNWFIERGIPRTLGILMHGLPGCGKTSVIKTLASYTKRRVVIIDLKLVYTKEHLKQIFKGKFKHGDDTLQYNQDELIYVLDDFDCMSDIFMDRDLKEKTKDDKQVINSQDLEIKRLRNLLKKYIKKKTKRDSDSNSDIDVKKNDTKQSNSKDYDFESLLNGDNNNSKITLQNILEILDGVVEMDGRMIIMTTNKRDILDPALIRPGRIDLDLEFEYPSRELIIYIFNYMYSNFSEIQRHEMLNIYAKFIKDKCLSTAKIMNCFMHMDMKDGMDSLISNYNYDPIDLDSGYNTDDDDDVIKYDPILELQNITKEIQSLTPTPPNINRKGVDILNFIDKKIMVSSNGRSSINFLDTLQNNGSFESLFSDKSFQYIKIMFEKDLLLTSYHFDIPEKSTYIMSNWELKGIRKDDIEESLDIRQDMFQFSFTGEITTDTLFKGVILRTKYCKDKDKKNTDKTCIVLKYLQFMGLEE